MTKSFQFIETGIIVLHIHYGDQDLISFINGKPYLYYLHRPPGYKDSVAKAVSGWIGDLKEVTLSISSIYELKIV